MTSLPFCLYTFSHGLSQMEEQLLATWAAFLRKTTQTALCVNISTWVNEIPVNGRKRTVVLMMLGACSAVSGGIEELALIEELFYLWLGAGISLAQVQTCSTSEGITTKSHQLFVQVWVEKNVFICDIYVGFIWSVRQNVSIYFLMNKSWTKEVLQML